MGCGLGALGGPMATSSCLMQGVRCLSKAPTFPVPLSNGNRHEALQIEPTNYKKEPHQERKHR